MSVDGKKTKRGYVRAAIENHVPTEEWERLQEVERIEKQTFDQVLEKITAFKDEAGFPEIFNYWDIYHLKYISYGI